MKKNKRFEGSGRKTTETVEEVVMTEEGEKREKLKTERVGKG